ncbi:nucleoside deaminase [bacterium BMS3Abin03]|jgi:tRNA(adenine34) deaminase|nr:nucleoside deaminase [bacterium BMS3Abin03]MCG6961337.1 nucleoside deaminase [bacterium BMS3Abin03]
MIFSEKTYSFMFSALQEAEKALGDKEVPIGAVVVKDEKIIGRGYNQVERLKDPTAHAEMIAITAASNHLGNWRLEGCSIYVSLEPCIMCTGAILASRIDGLYFAAFDPKFGACGSVHNLAEKSKTNHSVKVYSGIYSEESKSLLSKFFDQVRNTPKPD